MATRRRDGINQLPVYELAAQSAPTGKRLMQLGQNELGIEPSPMAIEAIHRSAGHLTRYPDPGHTALRHAIATYHNLNPDRIACGAGSIELMGLLTRALGANNP
jgi:histidinol-phosphate aminotransferase